MNYIQFGDLDEFVHDDSVLVRWRDFIHNLAVVA